MKTDENKRKASTTTGLSQSFPIDVIPSILSRLPVKSIVRFYIVCKEWHRLLHHPDFIDAHKARSKLLHGRYFPDLTTSSQVQMWDRRGKHLTWCYEPFIVLGSSDGLVCVQDEDGGYHICNPATRLSLAIPEVPGSEDWTDYDAPGFHFAMHLNPSTRQRKLARMRMHSRNGCSHSCANGCSNHLCFCEILTLEEGSRSAASGSSSRLLLLQPWKDVGSIPNPSGNGRIIFLFEKDGVVYWVWSRDEMHRVFIDIYVLDWTMESFTIITPPESMANIRVYQVLAWDDCLALGSTINKKLSVWILEYDRGSMKQTWRAEVVALEFLVTLDDKKSRYLHLERKDKDIMTFSGGYPLYGIGTDIYLYNTVSKEISHSHREDSSTITSYDGFYMPTLESCRGMVPVQDSTSGWFEDLVEKTMQNSK